MIKAGLVAYDKGREAAAGLSEMTEDLTAEVRSEMASQQAEVSPAAAEGTAG